MTTTFSSSSSATAPGTPSNGNWTLSNNNLTATRTPGGVTGQSTATKAMLSTKYYWEVTASLIGTGIGIGMVKSGDTITADQSTNSYYYSSDGKLYSGVAAGAGYGSTFGGNDVIGVAFDGANLWFSKNGTWQNSATLAEIAAGTTTHAAVTGLSGTFYPSIMDLSSAGTAVAGIIAVVTPLQFTVPTGFKPLDPATLSMTASPLSYSFSLIATTLKRALRMTASPLSFAFSLSAMIMHYGRYITALPISFALTLVTNILAAVVQPASKLKRRITAFSFSSDGRSAAPTLED